jgi:hypothetical protein
MESPARNAAMLHNHKRKSKAEKHLSRGKAEQSERKANLAFLSSKYGSVP